MGKLILKSTKYNVRWWSILAVFVIAITFTACNNDEDIIEIEEYPSLKVENLTTDGLSIDTVTLVGYDFTNLMITEGNSQTFILDKGMPGGYENININVRMSGRQIISRDIQVNFKKGETSTITMTGCNGYEGCKGYYIE